MSGSTRSAPALPLAVVVLAAAFAATFATAPPLRAQEARQPTEPTAVGESADSPAPDVAGDVELTFLLTGDMNGAFASLRCEDGATPDSLRAGASRTYADLVGGIGQVRAALRARGAPPPIVLDSGDLLGPAPFLRYALFQPTEGVPLVADLVAAAGYDSLSLGNGELTPEPERLLPLLDALAKRDVRFGAVNITCDPAKNPLGRYLRAGDDAVRIVERAGVRVAIVPVTSKKLAVWVDPAQLRGCTFRDENEAAAETVRRLREEGRADVVVVLAHVEGSATVPRASLKLARAVPQANVVVTNGFARRGDPGRSIRTVILQGGQPVVVGPPDVPSRLGRLTLTVRRTEGGAVTARPAPPIEIAPDLAEPVLVSRMEALQSEYCAEWGQPLGHGRIEPPIGANAFVRLVMEVMRRTHGATIALLNREAVDLPPDGTVGGPMTRDRLFRLLPYDDRLVETTLTGEELAPLLDAALPPYGAPAASDAGLQVLGAERTEDSFLLNGRTIETARRYDIVTVDFLASGGDDALRAIADVASWEPVAKGDDPRARLRDTVTWFFAEDRQRAVGGPDVTPDTIDPKLTFPSLWTLPLWTLAADVNGTFSHTGLRNPAGYDEAQLSREETLSISTESRFRVDMSQRDHGFASELNLRYGAARTGSQDLSETDDFIRFTSQYRWMWLRNRSGTPRVYMPVPYTRVTLESEFTVPADREDRHLEGTFEAGLEWVLTDTLGVAVGYGLRHQLIQEDDLHHGMMFRYELQRTELFSLFSAPVYFDSRFELFYSDLGIDDVLKGYGTNRLSLQVFGPLNFTVAHELFLFRRGSESLGVASDTQIGLQLYLDTFIQTF